MTTAGVGPARAAVIALTDVKGRLLWTSTARPARGIGVSTCSGEVDRLPARGALGLHFRAAVEAGRTSAGRS
ncbi:hypothetical protein [Streptomyces sp. NPDC058457]|uniref:hypothetical protein n=1 Tax=Streptomyces sp. NPDC058457 TaxID=3346507 RepID=UPI0036684E5B